MTTKGDPRELIETASIRLVCQGGIHGNHFWVAEFSGLIDWPEFIEFCRKGLAADEAWLDQNTPTIEELRARYPNIRLSVDTHAPLNNTWYAVYYPPGESIDNGTDRIATFLPNEKAALRWLRDELAKQALDAAVREAAD